MFIFSANPSNCQTAPVPMTTETKSTYPDGPEPVELAHCTGTDAHGNSASHDGAYRTVQLSNCSVRTNTIIQSILLTVQENQTMNKDDGTFVRIKPPFMDW